MTPLPRNLSPAASRLPPSACRLPPAACYSSYSSDPCTQMNDCASIMSRGPRSR